MEGETKETYRYNNHKDKLLKRLKRTEGQVRGVHRMIEEDRYCVEVLYQLAAIKAATNKIGLELIEDHTRGCVARAVKEKEDDGESHIQELMEVFRTFSK